MSPTDGEAYEAIAFLKNCLVRTVQKCAEFEILPLPGVGIRDELAVLDQYLTAHGLEPMKGIAEFSESYREQQPAALIHFSLAADSPQECLRSCVKNAEILGTVLALQRGAYPTVIGAIVINHQLGRYWWWVRKPTYTGNLVGGFLAGEQTHVTLHHFTTARKNDSLLLWLKLYRDAVAEEDTETAYYRYWSILEAIAATKHLGNEPKIGRDENVVLNRRGEVRYVGDEAEPRVLEMLRRVYVARNYSISFPLGHLFDLVRVWYRHRNCIAHRGGCHPDNPAHCYRDKPQFIQCRALHLAVVAQMARPRERHADLLLQELHDAVRFAIMHELNIST